MRTIIAGSRTIDDYDFVEEAIRISGYDISHIISGGAKGVDTLAEKYAKKQNIDITVMKADWKNHGKGAGIIRNLNMLEEAEALITVWDGISKGTEHIIKAATTRGLKVFVYRVETECENEEQSSIMNFSSEPILFGDDVFVRDEDQELIALPLDFTFDKILNTYKRRGIGWIKNNL